MVCLPGAGEPRRVWGGGRRIEGVRAAGLWVGGKRGEMKEGEGQGLK